MGFILFCFLRWLFSPFRYMLIHTVRFIVFISIPDEELVSETTFGCTASYLVKFYDVPVGFVLHPPFWSCVLLYLQSPKDGCCSISDDFSCPCVCVIRLYKVHVHSEVFEKYWTRQCISEYYCRVVATNVGGQCNIVHAARILILSEGRLLQ